MCKAVYLECYCISMALLWTPYSVLVLMQQLIIIPSSGFFAQVIIIINKLINSNNTIKSKYIVEGHQVLNNTANVFF